MKTLAGKFSISFAAVVIFTAICAVLGSTQNSIRFGLPGEFLWSDNGELKWNGIHFFIDLAAACAFSASVARFWHDPEASVARQGRFRRIWGDRDIQDSLDLMNDARAERDAQSHADEKSRHGR